MTKAGTTEAAVLGKLATTLDKLIEIKDAEAKKYRSIPTESKDITDLRNKVAERIAELNRA